MLRVTGAMVPFGVPLIPFAVMILWEILFPSPACLAAMLRVIGAIGLLNVAKIFLAVMLLRVALFFSSACLAAMLRVIGAIFLSQKVTIGTDRRI